METMDKTQRLNRTIPCSNCGEMYSISYKRCPFCGGTSRNRPEPTPPPQPRPKQLVDFDDDGDMDWTPELEGMTVEPTARGGKRLQRRKGAAIGRILLVILSLALVAGAVYIVLTKVAPLIQERFGGAGIVQNEDDPSKADPGTLDPVEPATTFRLLDTKVTLTQAGETKNLSAVLEGVGELGDLRWESSNPEIVSVSLEGKLTALAPGDAMISAVREDGLKAQCEVSCIWEVGAQPSNLSLNRDDFTIGKNDPSVMLKVIGTTETPVWSVKDPSIATVSLAGVVKHVSTGRTEVTATVGDKVLTCIVRCK